MTCFLPPFAEYIVEQYNAKLPDEINAGKKIDEYLVSIGFSKRKMPTALPCNTRFLYSDRNGLYVVVTVMYAGKDIFVEIPKHRVSARLNYNTLDTFLKNYLPGAQNK